MGTYLGDRRRDDRLDDRSGAAVAAHLGRLEGFRERAEAIGASELAGEDLISRSALIAQLRRERAVLEADLTSWSVDPMAGPQAIVLYLEAIQLADTPEQATAMISRWTDIGRFLDQAASDLRRRRAEGTVAVRAPVARVIDQLDDVLAAPDGELPLLKPLKVDRPEWSPGQLAAFREGLERAVREVARPALARYRDAL